MEETANNGTKWTFVSFGSEERRRRATRNSLTEQSGLSRRSRQMSDSPSGAFQLLLDIHIIFLIRNCTNVEARKYSVMKTGVCRVLRCQFLWHCFMYREHTKERIFLQTTSGISSTVSFFLETMTRIVFERSYDFCA